MKLYGEARIKAQVRATADANSARHFVAMDAQALVAAIHRALRDDPDLAPRLGDVLHELRHIVPAIRREHAASRALTRALGLDDLRGPLMRRRDRRAS